MASSSSPLAPTTHQNQNQNPSISNLPPYSTNPKKRALDHDFLLQTSPYFKIRAILNQLRPLFLQVIQAPDFQNCEAAARIQERMKFMVETCGVSVVKCSSGTRGVEFASEKQSGSQKYAERHQDKSFSSGNSFEKASLGSNRDPTTYIVGGSAFGWNFITFHGTKPEYYGRTKEAFRAAK